jgi:hypothetical protein
MELAAGDAVYEDIASKFFEHFVALTHAMHTAGDDGASLWDEADGFYYDLLRSPDGCAQPVRVRSLVGLIPLCAVETVDSEVVDRLPGFKRRLEWFLANRPVLCQHVESRPLPAGGRRSLLSVAGPRRLKRLLQRMLDEGEFLSPHGIRSVSRFHLDHPARMVLDGQEFCVDYQPGESTTETFGGNSNWRGPVWFPINYLLIEALQKFDWYAGESLKVEFPTGSGKELTLAEVAAELSRRLTRIFLRDDRPEGTRRRPVAGPFEKFQSDPHWRDLVLFHEYFHGDTGQGFGASHQTGWTALVAKLIQQSGE